MTKTMQRLHVVKVEDHEGDGTCRECGREGLRWIVTLSDGTQVGTECTKKLLGVRVTPTKHQWVTAFVAVAEHVETAPNGDTQTWVMWAHKNNPAATRETRNGHLVSVGGVRQDWTKRGWL